MVASSEASEILPDGVPVAVLVRRTYIVVEETVPPDWVRLTELAKPEVPDVLETSNPVGAVMVILFDKPEPETEKF